MTTRTLLDIELAKLFFEILVDLALNQRGTTITYGNLVKAAKKKFPDNQFVGSAIPTNLGRRLDALREFTNQRGLPDLSALVVSQSTGDNGAGFTRSFNGSEIRQKIHEFDWSSVGADFDFFICEQRREFENKKSRVTREKKITRDEAAKVWWDYYIANKAKLTHVTTLHKEEILNRIMGRVASRCGVRSVRLLNR